MNNAEIPVTDTDGAPNDKDSPENKLQQPDTQSDTADESKGSQSSQTNETSEELLAFISWLPKRLTKDESAGVFAMPSGLFVAEENVGAVLTAYEKFLEEHESNLSTEKQVRRLFGVKTPELFYLLVGKNCLAGYVIRCRLQAPQKYSLPVFQGEPLSATTLLHPKDPKLSDLPGINVEMGKAGLRITVKKGEREIGINTGSVSSFSSLVIEVPRLLNEFPSISRSQRDVLVVLAKALKEAKRAGKHDKIFIPQRLHHDKTSEYLRWRSFLFVIDAQENLTAVFDQRGRHFGDLLFSELAELRKKPRAGKLKLFEFPKRSERGMCGFIRLENELFKLSSSAFRGFADSAFRSRALQKTIPSKFTVADLLNELSRLVQKSSWVMEHDVPKRITNQHRGSNNFRSGKGWVFVIDKQSVIRYCHAPDEDRRQGNRGASNRDARSGRGRTKETKHGSSHTSKQKSVDGAK